jgi:hypothetical protein
MNIKRPKTIDEYIDLMHQAVYEIDEMRSSLDYDPEQSQQFGPFIDHLDAQVRKVFDDMVAGRYEWGYGEDFPFLPIVVKYGRFIPFQRLLMTLNDTHKNGLDLG